MTENEARDRREDLRVAVEKSPVEQRSTEDPGSYSREASEEMEAERESDYSLSYHSPTR